MNKTANLQLPLLQAAQAQKHVTVNSSLTMLDTLVQLRVKSSTEVSAPPSPAEGESYIVPEGATGSWQGFEGKIAVYINGGWLFHNSKPGWRVWDDATSATYIYDGARWVGGAVAVSSGGAATISQVIEFDHPVAPGASHFTDVAIPANTLVYGISGRVTSDLADGTLMSWRLGVQGSDNRYGSNFGVSENSTVLGLSGAPVAYYQDTPLLLTADNGDFSAGEVRLAIHCTTLLPPRTV
ncbi:DUF2793 domain-containing protein [Amaricoccus tamworthensis]|uniref:DUF2793 domain-containing protein n=1 Tax=Amaricoccus tamworthensis TaxID=57002 RepID=UPI003C7E56BE